MVEAGRLVLEANHSILVTSSAFWRTAVAHTALDFTSMTSFIFYLGVEGLGGVALDSSIDDSVSSNAHLIEQKPTS